MFTVDWHGLILFVVWFAWVAVTLYSLAMVSADRAFNGLPAKPVEVMRPEVTFVGSE